MGWTRWLLPFIALAVVLDIASAPPVLVFLASALGTIPAAAVMSTATEELAAQSGPTVGGLLNVTFGNAPELIIALLALGKGLDEVVKASLVGSVVGNVLLVTGAATLVGGLGKERQTFNKVTASALSLLLLIAVAALSLPAVLQLVHGGALPAPGAKRVDESGSVQTLAALLAGVLIITYAISLVFSLRAGADGDEPREEPQWSRRRAVIVLAVAAVGVALMSEILVGSIEHAARSAGLTEFFVGAIVVAVVGNVAEHWVAVVVARKDKLDLALQISIGSSVQVAMLVAPLVVLGSLFIGPHPLGFVLNGLELAALIVSALVANQITQDGESRWVNGVALLTLYVAIALTFGFA